MHKRIRFIQKCIVHFFCCILFFVCVHYLICTSLVFIKKKKTHTQKKHLNEINELFWYDGAITIKNPLA